MNIIETLIPQNQSPNLFIFSILLKAIKVPNNKITNIHVVFTIKFSVAWIYEANKSDKHKYVNTRSYSAIMKFYECLSIMQNNFTFNFYITHSENLLKKSILM